MKPKIDRLQFKKSKRFRDILIVDYNDAPIPLHLTVDESSVFTLVLARPGEKPPELTKEDINELYRTQNLNTPSDSKEHAETEINRKGTTETRNQGEPDSPGRVD